MNWSFRAKRSEVEKSRDATLKIAQWEPSTALGMAVF